MQAALYPLTDGARSALHTEYRYGGVHDIKAFGVTHHPSHESGHKSEKSKQVYLRGTKPVIATE